MTQNIDGVVCTPDDLIVPIYTCTTTASFLSTDAKNTLAGAIAHIHSSINHIPGTYVNVLFQELSADNVYTGGVPASPVLVSGRVREGQPAAETTRLATERGHVLPEPGMEEAWIARDRR